MRFEQISEQKNGLPVLAAEAAGVDREELRECLNRLGRSTGADCQLDLGALARRFDGCADEAAFFAVECLLQGAYRFGKEALRRCTPENIYALRGALAAEPDVTVYLISKEDVGKAVRKGEALGRCRNYARMLGDLPANFLDADAFCRYAECLAREKTALRLEVYRDDALREMRCGGILAVNGASQKRAALLCVRCGEGEPEKVTALVGKGVLFDSGGICLKDMKSMDGMKYDMCGAADVLCLLEYAAETGGARPLLGVIPLAENAVGPGCVRMGDVITTHSGKTVEVYNTDAEGRLLLADALAYAAPRAARLIDLATLTCSAQEALGDETTGFFANDEALARCVWDAASKTGEPVWRLPLARRFYKKLLWTKTADLANYMPAKSAGASVAACFLEAFVGGRSWVHLDMVGPAVARAESGRWEKGATGTNFAVVARLLGLYGNDEERRAAVQ